MVDYLKIRCPVCKGKLLKEEGFRCVHCNIAYPIRNGIPYMLPSLESVDNEQDIDVEKKFYEKMFSNLKGLDDGHCVVYGYERIYEVMESIERGKVIEVGCGTGHHSVHMVDMGFDVTSIDLSSNALMAANNLAKHEGKDVLFVCGDIKQLPFDDNEFDICFCSLILHHFIGLDNIVKELSRVTRKYFVAFEVNALDPISYIRFNVINPIYGIKTISKNQRALFPKDLKNALIRNGFKDIEVSYEDIRNSVGQAPDSIQAKIIYLFRMVMKVFPKKYSRNKFLLLAKK